MNNYLAFDLSIVGLIVFAVIAIIVIILMFNSRVNAYLQQHFTLDNMVNSFLWLSLWFIGNEFMKWWISGIIAFIIATSIDKIANKYQ